MKKKTRLNRGAIRKYKNLLHVARKIESSNNPKAVIEK